MDNSPIITVKEARKLLGNFGKTLEDTAVKDLIKQLDGIARAFINDSKY